MEARQGKLVVWDVCVCVSDGNLTVFCVCVSVCVCARACEGETSYGSVWSTVGEVLFRTSIMVRPTSTQTSKHTHARMHAHFYPNCFCFVGFFGVFFCILILFFLNLSLPFSFYLCLYFSTLSFSNWAFVRVTDSLHVTGDPAGSVYSVFISMSVYFSIGEGG